MARLNLLVTDRKDGDDDHVQGVAEIPPLRHVGERRQGHDTREDSHADKNLRGDPLEVFLSDANGHGRNLCQTCGALPRETLILASARGDSIPLTLHDSGVA